MKEKERKIRKHECFLVSNIGKLPTNNGGLFKRAELFSSEKLRKNTSRAHRIKESISLS